MFVDENEVGDISRAQKSAFRFADDAGGDGGGHFQGSNEAETPFDVIANHRELSGGAAAERRDAAAIHRAGARDDQAVFLKDDFEATLNLFAGRASGGGTRVTNDGDLVGAFGGDDEADHFDREMESIGNDFAGEGRV